MLPSPRAGHGLSYTEFDLGCVVAEDAKYVCTVTNKGNVDGDEVIFAWHVPGDDVRAGADHVLPLKRLVGFERVSTRAGGASAEVVFSLSHDALELVTADGGRKLYSGTHTLEFSNGVGKAIAFEVHV